MVRGTFANIRIKNKMIEQTGGYTKHHESEIVDEIYEVASKYRKKYTFSCACW